jgi:hypothetical protein
MKAMAGAVAALSISCVFSAAFSANAEPKAALGVDPKTAEAVLAPLRAYQVLAADPNSDGSAFASIFDLRGFTFLHSQPSYFWTFPTAPGRPDLGADNARAVKEFEQTSGPTFPPAPARILRVTGDRAYAVVPENGRVRRHGKLTPFPGTYVLGLHRVTAGWRIVALSWQDVRGQAGYHDASPAEAAPVIAAARKYLANPDPATTGVPLAADGAIIDEFAPYYWQGPSAFTDWWQALQAVNAAQGISDLRIALKAADRVLVTGGRAYLVLPARLEFRTKRRPGREDGAFTLALEKTAAGWTIDGWAWAPAKT